MELHLCHRTSIGITPPNRAYILSTRSASLHGRVNCHATRQPTSEVFQRCAYFVLNQVWFYPKINLVDHNVISHVNIDN